MNKRIDVIYERDHSERVWLVRLADDDRAHTYGRTVQAARRAIREVVALWHDLEPQDYELVETFVVSPEVDAARRMREEADAAQAQALAATTLAAKAMVDGEDISLRDAAEVLGVSFQRVHQLVH